MKKKCLVCFLNLLLIISVHSMSWIEQKSTGIQSWSSVEATLTQFFSCVQYGYVYSSFDGSSWNRISSLSSANWNSISSSNNTKYLIASTSSSYAYTSSDGGSTWKTLISPVGRSWQDVATSNDGKKMVGVTLYYILTSSDQGASWSSYYIGYRYYYYAASVAISADGSIIVVVRETYNPVYTSTNGGTNWNKFSYGAYSSVAMSSDGSRIMTTAASTGYISLSLDYGKTWVPKTTAGYRIWTSIAMSADGMTILASVSNGYLYLSRDGGENWVEQTEAGTRAWSSVSVSPLADRFIASVSSGYLYTMIADCEVGSYIQTNVGCVKCPENMHSSTINSKECYCPQNYYLEDQITCKQCPLYWKNSHNNSNECHFIELQLIAALIIFIICLNAIYLNFHFLHPHLTILPKLYYFIMFLLPHLTYLLHILYWFMELFRNKTIFILYGLTILLPFFPFLHVIWKIKLQFYIPKSFYQMIEYFYWISYVDNYPGVYNQRLSLLPYNCLDSSILQVPIWIILWIVAIIIQIICFIPLFYYSMWLIVSNIVLIVFGLFLYQMKLLCYNYVWNTWLHLYVGPEQPEQQQQQQLSNTHQSEETKTKEIETHSSSSSSLIPITNINYFKEERDLIDEQLFNESLRSQIIYQTIPHFILQIINISETTKKQNLLSIITLLFTLLYLFLYLIRVMYWSIIKGISLEKHPVRFFPPMKLPFNMEKYSDLEENVTYDSIHEMNQVKRLLSEQNEKMKSLEDTILQLKKEKELSKTTNQNNDNHVNNQDEDEDSSDDNGDIETKSVASSDFHEVKLEEQQQHSLISTRHQNKENNENNEESDDSS